MPFFISFFASNRLPISFVRKIYKIGTSWVIILIYLSLIFGIIDIIKMFGVINITKYTEHSVIGWGVLISFLTIIFWYGNKQYYRKKIVSLDIETTKRLSMSLKIVLISDLHLGYAIDRDELEDWVALINKQNPDLVIIAGDVIDNYIKPIIDSNIDAVFRKIKSKNGVYMALGNHEYFGNIEKRLRFFKKANITVLRDKATLIKDSFYLVGRDDASRQYRNHLHNIIEPLDSSKPIIVIDHQPKAIKEAVGCEADLILCGHTHYGQVFPLNILMRLLLKNPYGYYRHNNTRCYVTSGIGLWGGKFRIGTDSEIVVINWSDSTANGITPTNTNP